MNLPLTPIRFLLRAREQFGGKIGVLDGDRSWSYREYFERCLQLGDLIRSWKLSPAARIGYLSYNSHHLLEAYYGVLLGGGIVLPLNVRLTPDELAFILNDAEAEALFFHPDFLPAVERMRPRLEAVRRMVLLEPGPERDWLEPEPVDRLTEGRPPEMPFEWTGLDENAVAEVFYTSGTTSRPKGVMLTHRNLYLHALQTGITLGCTDADVQLHTIPLFHVNGWGTPQFLTCMGGTHVMARRFDPAEVLEGVERHRVTTFSLVPTMAIALLNCPDLTRRDLGSLRLISLGGSASNPRLIRDLEEAFGCTCVGGYGLTETSPVVSFSWVKSHLEASGQERRRIQAMTGYPTPGVELRVVDEQGRPLPWDGRSVGEIVVRADTVMKGYWKRPEENEAAFRDGWFHTGDMAVVDPDGYLLIVDRKKDIIISGGENISSLEVEKALLTHPDVLECAVIPRPDETWGEVPLALVVLKPDREASEEELLGHCREHLAGFKIPRAVKFLDTLPKGGTGKILKRELRDRYGR